MKQVMDSAGKWGRFEAEGPEHHAEGDISTRHWYTQMVHIEDASGYEDHEADDLRNNGIENLHCWL
ncbi:MAG: hypothetical protein JXA24_07410 [Proteobacteria bacterium]|nr:hypothetical protein [Pseudomonadota bacterium]